MLTDEITSLPSRRPRILHLASGDLWGGAEVQVSHMLSALQDGGDVDVRVVLLNHGIMSKRLTALRLDVTVIDEARHSARQIFARLLPVVRAWRPQVIHTHRRKEHFIGGLVGLATRTAVVGTMHGRPEKFSHSSPWRDTCLYWLEIAVLRWIHAEVIAVSEELVAHIRVPRHKVIVIPNGIDPSETLRHLSVETCQLDDGDRIRLAFLGRLVPVKQPGEILHALAELEAESPGRYCLYLIGDGPLRVSLDNLATELGISGIVKSLGFQPDPLPLMAKMDMVLFASSHEGLPMTALEALALGVPVVAPPVGGLQQLLSESPIGRLAASADGPALAAAIRDAVSSGMYGRQWSSDTLPESYLLTDSIRRYIDMYHRVGCLAPRKS